VYLFCSIEEKMNCLQANQLNINDFLNKLGIKGQPYGHKSTLYFSPFRHEKTPSFHVYSDSNRWHDFGSGENGDLVSLVQKLYGYNPSQALEILSNGSNQKPANVFFPIEQNINKEKNSDKDLFLKPKFEPVTNREMISYLASRGIIQQIWSNQSQLKQISYHNYTGKQGKRFFTCLAWANDTGGYEIRGIGDFKTTFGHKDITTIEGVGNDLNIFEGFFSYMSALVYFKTTKLKNTTIVLNSLSNLKKARPAMDKAEFINLFLDNDTAGTGAANNLQATRGNCMNRSQAFHPDHKDFNELIKSQLNINNHP
jgi:hypothetical protein